MNSEVLGHSDIADALTRNAFDFLTKAIEEFDTAPKYSVIHFCAAIEMLLKGRLMQEHWSLIVGKPEQANLAKFIAGDFVSVTLEETRNRLRDIVDQDISDEAFNSFRTLATHRNKMIHFFHAGIEDDKQAKAQIEAEHCRAWFHLHRLLEQWDGYFHHFRKEIASADRTMKRHRKYLSAKFKALKSELAAARKSGTNLQACNACGFKGAIPGELDSEISTVRCRVCDHTETQVQIDCPHCSEFIVIAGEGWGTCEYCIGKIEPEHLREALTDQGAVHIAIKDGDDSWGPINCGSCEGYHTVVQREGDIYFCANCFDFTDHVETCGWCNELNTGDMEASYWAGCTACDGNAGWTKDD